MSEVRLPRLGYATDEGTVLAWLPEVGAQVRRGEALVEVASEKAVHVVPAPADGTLLAVYAPPGAIVPAGEVIAWLGAAGEQAPALTPRWLGWAEEVAAPPPDLSRHLEAPGGAGAGAEAGPAPEVRAPQQVPPPYRRLLRSQLRRTTAQRLTRSWEAPKVDLFTDVDFSRVVAHRDGQKRAGGEPPSYNVYIAHAVVQAFGDLPHLNGYWHRERMVPLETVSVGIAVALGDNLVTVSLKDLAGASLHDIQRRFKALIRKAAGMQLSAAELYGSSLTITNLGEFEVTAFAPVLNPPELFILAIGALEERPVVRDGQVVAAPMCTFCLSFDHRGVDGAPASRLLQRIKHHLEHYGGEG